MRVVRRLLRLFPIALCGVLVVGLLLLFLLRIERTVEATGEVRVSNYQVVRPEVAGIVGEVYVEPGTMVNAGQMLCRLVDYEFERQRLAVAQQLGDALARRSALNRRRRQLEADVHPLELARQRKRLDGERLEREAAIFRAREAEVQLRRAEETLARVQELGDAGLLSEQAINEARYDTEQIELQLERIRVEERLAREQSEAGSDDFELLGAEQESALADLAAEQEQLTILIDQLSAQQAQLERVAELYVLRAEIDGLAVGDPVEELRGRRVQAGDEVLSIIDTSSVHFVTYVPEAAIVKVDAGQEAYVELTGLPKRNFDVFRGEVLKVAAEPQLLQSSEEILYPVEIHLRQPWVFWEENRFYLRSGMRGVARISYRNDVRFLRAIYETVVGDPAGRQAPEPPAARRVESERPLAHSGPES